MGQAWCKEKSSKAQDSKSPLDRVFVRCAHRIYPGLKEEGSVLGATQRVTSSEIGYAGSPPRASLLQRGQSIDSVDRPFHPSEWVDVNLEVPCTPRASVLLSSANQQRSSNLPKSGNDIGGRRELTMSGGAPVPPPRRRRRRERRPLPPKPGHSADDESEPEPLYTQLASPSRPLDAANCSTTTLDDEEGTRDSDDEFLQIERSLAANRSLEELPASRQEKASRAAARSRPKNHSTTSLPNVAELLDSPAAEEAAKRPPRHIKTASLPRDAALCAPLTPERLFFARRIEEDGPEEQSGQDNSIFEPNGQLDVRTSTPAKEEGAKAAAELEEVFESFRDESSKSRDSSSASAAVEELDRPASPAEESARRTEDAGYVSRSSEQQVTDESGFELLEVDELSSGILRDAIFDSSDSQHFGNPIVLEVDDEDEDLGVRPLATVHRTISEESLPCEMLVEELDEEEEDVTQAVDEEKSAKEASNQLTRQARVEEVDASETPPPSPESKTLSATHIDEQSPAVQPKNPQDNQPDNPASSMTPSLLELEAALTDMLERKDEAERELEVAKSSSKSPEPQIVPVKLDRSPEDGAKPAESSQRLIDFPRADRTNPFNDVKSDELIEHNSSTDEPPEKPSRLHRISLLEESVIEEPLIVPTPPRRRHRNSKLNLSSESVEPIVHTYASGDRLI